MLQSRQEPCRQEARDEQQKEIRWNEEQLQSTEDMIRLLETLGAIMAQRRYSEADRFAVRLGLEEAIVNAVKHGHQGDRSRPVWVRYRIEPEQMLAEVEDQGPGFDPHQVPDPLAPENLERSSGRGLLLMRHYLTGIRYNARGNCVTLWKSRSPVEADAECHPDPVLSETA